MGFWAALQFLTILPSPVRRPFSAEEMGRSVLFFPVVGLFLGLALWGADTGLALIGMPALVANGLLLAGLVLLTGGLHVDGFIDTCDGLAVGGTPERRLGAMADSRVGALGAAGAVMILLFQFVSLYSAAGPARTATLVTMPVQGRWAMAYSLYAFPYARGESGKGAVFKVGAGFWRVVAASVIAAAIAVITAGGWQGAAAMGIVWLVVFLLSSFLVSRLRGLTGDSYGAINEVAELTALIAMPMVWRIG